MTEQSINFFKILRDRGYTTILVRESRILYTNFFEYSYLVSKDETHFKPIGFISEVIGFKMDSGYYSIDDIITEEE